MPVGGGDHLQGDAEAVGDLLLQRQRVEPVAVHPGHQRARGHPGQGRRHPAPVAADVPAVHRLGEHHVAAGVEPAGQLVGVVVEVGGDGEPAVVLDLAAEALAELEGAPVGQVRDPAGDAQPRDRGIGERVVAAGPARVGPDRRLLRRLGADLVGGGDGARGQEEQRGDAVGHRHGPLQRPHAAHRAADDARPAADPEGVGQRRLDADLVADGHLGEAGPPAAVVRGRGGGPRRPLAAAQHVGADDEEAVGVQRAARADQPVPPAPGRVPGPGRADDVAVAGERVLDEDGVAAVLVERPPRLERDPHAREDPAALGAEGPGQVEEPAVARRVPLDPPAHRQARLGGAEPGLEVGDDVLDALQADGQAHQARRDAGRQLLLGGQLRVRRRGRVDDQAADVADVGHVAVQLERLDELLAGLDAAVQLEGRAPRRRPSARTSAAPRATSTTGSPG